MKDKTKQVSNTNSPKPFAASAGGAESGVQDRQHVNMTRGVRVVIHVSATGVNFSPNRSVNAE